VARRRRDGRWRLLGLGLALGWLWLLAAAPAAGAGPDEVTARVQNAVRPLYDRLAVALRLGLSGPPEPIAPPRLTAADVGRVDRFRVLDQTQTPNVQFEVEAELRLVTPHAYWYFERGRPVDEAGLQAAAAQYEQTIYPLLQRIVAGPRAVGPITLLHARVPGVAGYFSSSDLSPRWVVPHSNERPMVYLDPSAIRVGSAGYAHLLAHELTHLFHYFANPGEETWLKEGSGELAQELVDPEYHYGVRSFLLRPDTQLTAWSASPANSAVYYQAAYLFVRYLMDRYGGPDVLSALFQSGQQGAASVDAFLAALGRPERFTDVFRDWVVANVVQDRGVADGRYGYARALDGQPRMITATVPSQEDGRVPQFGTDYYRVTGPGDVRVRFRGVPTVPAIGALPPGGVPFWWSNRGDMMDARLTRALDLRAVAAATLTFDLRYDTEDAYDYGYVAVSTDGGARWQLLAGQHTTTENPAGRNLGVGYNGRSNGDGSWVHETIDLSPFAGQQLLLRFNYITDDSYNAEGVAIANVAVPELGWQDDGSGWTSEGWVWIDGPLTQPFAVQLIEYQGETPRVRALPLDAAATGETVIRDLGGTVRQAVVAVSGLAPVTLQPARYTISFEPATP
jgi:immune inhibitor A